ncbi:hypothetical protein [Azospirillum sp.]|uniref:hypothetical protein n=1 Tax=Azospirillum sp. TaxID=34012 RepID=UPI003D74AE54
MVDQTRSLSPALIAFLQGDVSLTLACRDAAGWPTLGRALACEVSSDGGRLTVYLARTPNAALLAAVMESGLAALVVTKPSTHHSVQLKGRDAAVVLAGEGAGPAVAHHVAGFTRDVGLIGFSAAFSRTLMAHDPRDLAAVTFTPEAAFDQTPGPRAGDPVQP